MRKTKGSNSVTINIQNQGNRIFQNLDGQLHGS